RLSVPHTGRVPGAGQDDMPAVGTEDTVIHVPGLPFQCVENLASSGVPQARGAVQAVGDQELAIGTECGEPAGVRGLEEQQLLAGGRVPELDGSVSAAVGG